MPPPNTSLIRTWMWSLALALAFAYAATQVLVIALYLVTDPVPWGWALWPTWSIELLWLVWVMWKFTKMPMAKTPVRHFYSLVLPWFAVTIFSVMLAIGLWSGNTDRDFFAISLIIATAAFGYFFWESDKEEGMAIARQHMSGGAMLGIAVCQVAMVHLDTVSWGIRLVPYWVMLAAFAAHVANDMKGRTMGAPLYRRIAVLITLAGLLVAGILFAHWLDTETDMTGARTSAWALMFVITGYVGAAALLTLYIIKTNMRLTGQTFTALRADFADAALGEEDGGVVAPSAIDMDVGTDNTLVGMDD